MFAAGQTVGNYRVLAKIGTGGMGAVYLAVHPLINKRVALKVIHRELSANKEVVQRFFQEARAVNQIGNEHIVEIHDFGMTPQGDHFYIMEYLEGVTLAAVMARDGVIAPMRSVHIIAQTAHALGAAHDAGILHRDLKPDNIMLTQRLGNRDFVKVLDFGLAKVLDANDASAVKTAVGILLGTPQYMSPEACEGQRPVDHRNDIYALGIMMFQMMTGRLPFDGDSMGEVLVKQVSQLPPAPRGLNADIPPAVEQIILRCLAKQPYARFQTMQELCDALMDPEAYLRGSPPIGQARTVTPEDLTALPLRRVAGSGATERAGSEARTLLDGDARLAYPGVSQPATPEHKTMMIATPPGYSSGARRGAWPIVLGVGAVLGLVGGIAAIAFGGGDLDARAEPVEAADRAGWTAARSDGSGSGAGTPRTDAIVQIPADAPDAVRAAPASPMARLTLASRPERAIVIGPDGRELGHTPLTIDWRISPEPSSFTFRHKGYADKKIDVVVGRNTTSRVQLERASSQRPKGAPRGSAAPPRDTGSAQPPDRDGLIRP